MRRAFLLGSRAGLVVAVAAFAVIGGVSWLVEQMDRAERGQA